MKADRKSRAACASTAGTVTCAPWSPPIQSMATVTSIGNPPLRAPTVVLVRPRTCNQKDKRFAGLLVFGLDDLLSAVIAGRADVVPEVDFPRSGFHRERRRAQMIVRAMHPSLRWRLLVLLNSHGVLAP